MAVIKGVQLPVDGAGKITGAFGVPQPDGSTLWVPATVLVDANGNEIGSKLLTALEGLNDQVTAMREQLELSDVLA